MNKRLWKVTTTVTDHEGDTPEIVTLDIASSGETRGKARSNAVFFLQSEYDSDVEYTHRMSIKRTDLTAKHDHATWWEDCPICITPSEASVCQHTTDEMLSAWEAQAHAEIEAIFGTADEPSALDALCYAATGDDDTDDPREWTGVA